MNNYDQKTIINRVFALCKELKHNEAIQLTNHIDNSEIAIKAHMLCIEHEQRCRLDGIIPTHL